jgi:anti-anti-sigma factor
VSETCKVSSERRGDVAILWTDGYINNQGGEEIAREAYAHLGQGARALVLNLEKTRIVNSIGISILIEVLEKVMDSKGVLAFCGLTPTIDKTFRIMGLAQYARIYPSQEEALRGVGGPAA